MRFMQIIALAVIATISTLTLAEAVDVEAAAIRGWNERELLQGRASIPNPTPTGTTTTPVPRPTGSKDNSSKCTMSAQCKTGNCSNGKCQPVIPLGSQCTKAVNCASLNCVSSKCVPQPGKGQSGDVCNANNQCSGPSYCNRGKCDITKPSGNVCYIDDGCTSRICLNKRCILPGSQVVSAACTADNQCVNGAFCNTSKCAVKKSKNAVCYKAVGCKSGVCRNKKCT